MCYRAYTEKARTRRIAGKDIKVYKICNFHENKISSYYKHYLYTPLVITSKINITVLKEYTLPYIMSGYHSFTNCHWHRRLDSMRAVLAIVNDSNLCFKETTNAVIAEFIIPKNTAYYENSNGEIVSEQIMFTGTIHKPIIYDNGVVEPIKINLNEENRTVPTEACE